MMAESRQKIHPSLSYDRSLSTHIVAWVPEHGCPSMNRAALFGSVLYCGLEVCPVRAVRVGKSENT